jgi:prepilin-type N-terminal cleavage/methylation domain-containing protein
MGDRRRRRRGAPWRRRRGHTLTELMVVIAIILTVIALSLPYYMKAIKMARGVAQGDQAHR